MAPCAKDIMTRDVITVPKNMDAREAALVLSSHRITGAPVVDSDSSLVGVISDTDLVKNSARKLEKKVSLSPYFTRLELETLKNLRTRYPTSTDSNLLVADLMTPYAITVEEDTEVGTLARIMLKERVHRVLVVKKGQLTGIVSTMDVVRAVVRFGLRLPARRKRPGDRPGESPPDDPTRRGHVAAAGSNPERSGSSSRARADRPSKAAAAGRSRPRR